jgi:hypothetical protein
MKPAPAIPPADPRVAIHAALRAAERRAVARTNHAAEILRRLEARRDAATDPRLVYTLGRLLDRCRRAERVRWGIERGIAAAITAALGA